MPTALLRRQRTVLNDPGYVSANAIINRALATLRKHLKMDVAFVSQVAGDVRIFRNVDCGHAVSPIAIGDTLSLSDGYCQKIVDGNLPELIRNTSELAAACEIPDTHSIPIGSHISVPLRLSSGYIYGTVCCFSFGARSDLGERDLAVMKAFAEIISHQIEAEVEGVRGRIEIFDRIDTVLRSDQPNTVYQPIYRMADRCLIGAEALARFAIEPRRTPDVWFAEADQISLQADLELKAIRSAIDRFAPVWRKGTHYLGVNASPDTILDPRLDEALSQAPPDRLVLEITEHCHVESYDELMRALAPIRERGVKVAVDDAGSGYASMRHILNIKPDIIKLDVSLTQEIDTDRTRLALGRALCEFGRQTSCNVVAEGVETESQLQTLRGIGVHAAQGYFLGRPEPFAQFRDLLPRAFQAEAHSIRQPIPHRWSAAR